MAASPGVVPAAGTVNTSIADPSGRCAMVAIRVPSGDHAGNENLVPVSPKRTGEPPSSSMVDRPPVASTMARRAALAMSVAGVAGVGAGGGVLTTPRPDTKARTTIDATSVSRTATVRARRTWLPGVGIGGRGTANAGSSMFFFFKQKTAYEIDAPM